MKLSEKLKERSMEARPNWDWDTMDKLTFFPEWVGDAEELEAENARLQEQNVQLVFATELLVKELNALKEVKQEECPEINISP